MTNAVVKPVPSDADLNQRASEAVLQRSSPSKVAKYSLLIATTEGGIQILYLSNHSNTKMLNTVLQYPNFSCISTEVQVFIMSNDLIRALKSNQQVIVDPGYFILF